MEHSIAPKIMDPYDPKAENNYTLKRWFKKSPNNIRSYWVLDSLSVNNPYIHSGELITCFLYAKPHSFGERINKLANSEKGFEMRANLYIITSMSIMFSLYAIMMSIIACAIGKNAINSELRKWYDANEEHVQNLNSVNIIIPVEIF